MSRLIEPDSFDRHHIKGLNSKVAKLAFDDIRKDPDNKGYYEILGTVMTLPTVLTEDSVIIEDLNF